MKLGKKQGIAWALALALSTSTLMAADYDTHWAKDAIDTWQTYGVIEGYGNDIFKPNGEITRAEFATILSRVFNLSERTGAPTYADILINYDKWYVAAVEQVNLLGWMYIEGIHFKPNQPITREEAAYALAKAYDLVGENQEAGRFTDAAKLSPWAVEGINALTSGGYINGNPDGSFNPKGTLTRAELVTMLNNMTQHLITKPGVYTQSLKGNVVINTKGVTLQNMTIEGHLYLAQGIGSEAVSLENVTVKGNTYINGGTVTLSGNYDTVYAASGRSIHLTKGSIKEVVVNQKGSLLTVDEGAAVAKLTQNQGIGLDGKGTIAGQPIVSTVVTGGGAGGGAGQLQEVEITSAGIYINHSYVSLPVEGNAIVLDIPALAQSFSLEDEVNGLIIETSEPGATISSQWGSMSAGTQYSFEEAEEALGIIRQVALEVGVSPTLVIDYVLGVERLTIGSLLEDFKTAIQEAGNRDIVIPESYEFTRSIQGPSGKTGHFTINMFIK